MRDWTGSRIRADAWTVPCRYCAAIAGEPCVTDTGAPLEAFPAHTLRISDARKAVGETHPYATEDADA